MSSTEESAGAARMALAAMLHDLGKFAERARIDVDSQTLESNCHQYCPSREAGGRSWFTHKHAAYTAVAMDLLESRGLLPPIVGTNLYPFQDWRGKEADDSLINAAARHHRPETYLQWIIATADRVASGFEREEFDQYNCSEEGTSTGKNHYTARQLSLFEQVRLSDQEEERQLEWRYPLKPMSVAALMPQPSADCEGSNKTAAQAEYHESWERFLSAMEKIPESHKSNLPLWLDHFESCWLTFTHAIPSATAFGVRPEVSLYDHAKAVAALATSFWKYHEDRGDDPSDVATSTRYREDWGEKKLLLVQGDLFGIQDFIFASGGSTRKRAAKLLRGRSFQVALMTECAALRVLDELGLPSTSQITNAAGKFLIVAPNTKETIEALERVRNEFDEWFLKNTWGRTGVGLVWMPAACNDFLRRKGNRRNFQGLMKDLFDQLDQAKRQRFDLCSDRRQPVFEEYLDAFSADLGVCQVDDRSPATVQLDENVFISQMANDQITIGNLLTKKDRLLITREPLNHNTLEMDIFGYYVSFTDSENASGKFGRIAADGTLLRAWDFSLPNSAEEDLFHGYARRWINGYVPRFSETDEYFEGRYARLKATEDELDIGDVKTFNHIACDDLQLDDNDDWVGVDALMTFKGDVDNLGSIFQEGLEGQTFAKMAALSRQVNSFFAIYLPWLCQERYPNTYTVFAGGDDFFLIGPWRSQMNLARDMRSAFSKYVAGNPEIHFSAGLSMSRPGLPVRYLAERGEAALESAKEHESQEGALKNAVTCHGQTLGWDDFERLSQSTKELEDLAERERLSTGYIYGLLSLVDMAENLRSKSVRPENAMWHSRFAYRTRRMIDRKGGLKEEERKKLHNEITQVIAANGIDRYAGDYRIALTTYLYKNRKTGA